MIMDFCNLSRSNFLTIRMLAVVTFLDLVEVKTSRQRPGFCRTLCCNGESFLREMLVQKDLEKDRMASHHNSH